MCVKKPSLNEANQHFTLTLHPSHKSAYMALDVLENAHKQRHTQIMSEYQRHFPVACCDLSKCSHDTEIYSYYSSTTTVSSPSPTTNTCTVH